MTMTIDQRFDTLDQLIEENRVIRWQWNVPADDTADGRERLCLLAAISPEVVTAQTHAACPAALLPGWLAELTPSIDDHTSGDKWPQIIREFSRAVRAGAARLDAAGWERVKLRLLLAIVGVARRHGADACCILASRILTDALNGSPPNAAARSAASDFMERAERDFYAACDEAADASWDALCHNPSSAATSAARAARAASIGSGHTLAHAHAARCAAWDEVAAALFAAIDAEVAA